MIHLWDLKAKQFKWKHVDWGVTLCEATLSSFGVGIEGHYSGNPAFHRYDKSFWISFRLLWIDVTVHADWGRKQEHMAVYLRMREDGVKSKHVFTDAWPACDEQLPETD